MKLRHRRTGVTTYLIKQNKVECKTVPLRWTCSRLFSASFSWSRSLNTHFSSCHHRNTSRRAIRCYRNSPGNLKTILQPNSSSSPSPLSHFPYMNAHHCFTCSSGSYYQHWVALPMDDCSLQQLQQVSKKTHWFLLKL